MEAAVGVFVASIPLDQLPVEGIGSASVLVGAGFAFLALVGILARRSVRRFTGLHLLLSAFVFWAVASLLWSADVESSHARAVTFVQLLMVALLIWQTARERASVANMALAYVLGSSANIVGTVVTFLRGDTYRPYMERFAGLGYDPNDLSVTLAIGIGMAWLVVLERKGWQRRLSVAFIPTAVLAVALTGSRGGALATVTALLVVPVSLWHLSRGAKTLVLSLGVLGAIGLIRWVPETTWERLGSTQAELAGGTMTNRTYIWDAGLQIFERNWFNGVGIGGFGEATLPLLGVKTVAHNTLLGVAVELGVVGAVLFVAAWAYVLALTRKVEASLRPTLYLLMLTWFVGAASLSWEFRKYTWFILAFVAHAATVLRQGNPLSSTTGHGKAVTAGAHDSGLPLRRTR